MEAELPSCDTKLIYHLSLRLIAVKGGIGEVSGQNQTGTVLIETDQTPLVAVSLVPVLLCSQPLPVRFPSAAVACPKPSHH